MPQSNEEQRRRKAERNRKWREKNRERKREYERAYRLAHPEKEAARLRRHRAIKAGVEPAIEDLPVRRAAGGAQRSITEENRTWRLGARHRMTDDQWAAMWDQQDGRCYLCGQPVTLESAKIEHDHRCCPHGWSCKYCRRGLACHNCNTIIGLAGDDAEVLRRIAANLEAAMAAVTERMAARPQQLELC